MCSNGTGAQCRSYFVVLSLHGYATHAIFDDHNKLCFMFMDYITYQGVTQDVAEQMMLQDLERLFRKSRSSLEKFGFPTPDNVPTELEEAISLWMQSDVMERQGQLRRRWQRRGEGGGNGGAARAAAMAVPRQGRRRWRRRGEGGGNGKSAVRAAAMAAPWQGRRRWRRRREGGGNGKSAARAAVLTAEIGGVC